MPTYSKPCTLCGRKRVLYPRPAGDVCVNCLAEQKTLERFMDSDSARRILDAATAARR